MLEFLKLKRTISMSVGKGKCFLLKYVINIAHCKGEICIASFGNKKEIHD